MDDLYRLLTDFERKLEQLRKQGGLATRAAELFKEFSAEVERRTGGDRRASSRSTPDRRKTELSGFTTSGDDAG